MILSSFVSGIRSAYRGNDTSRSLTVKVTVHETGCDIAGQMMLVRWLLRRGTHLRSELVEPIFTTALHQTTVEAQSIMNFDQSSLPKLSR